MAAAAESFRVDGVDLERFPKTLVSAEVVVAFVNETEVADLCTGQEKRLFIVPNGHTDNLFC